MSARYTARQRMPTRRRKQVEATESPTWGEAKEKQRTSASGHCTAAQPAPAAGGAAGSGTQRLLSACRLAFKARRAGALPTIPMSDRTGRFAHAAMMMGSRPLRAAKAQRPASRLARMQSAAAAAPAPLAVAPLATNHVAFTPASPSVDSAAPSECPVQITRPTGRPPLSWDTTRVMVLPPSALDTRASSCFRKPECTVPARGGGAWRQDWSGLIHGWRRRVRRGPVLSTAG